MKWNPNSLVEVLLKSHREHRGPSRARVSAQRLSEGRWCSQPQWRHGRQNAAKWSLQKLARGKISLSFPGDWPASSTGPGRMLERPVSPRVALWEATGARGRLTPDTASPDSGSFQGCLQGSHLALCVAKCVLFSSQWCHGIVSLYRYVYR